MVLRRDAVSLAGHVAVVTGGGAGIGRAVAAAFAEFGASVAVWEKDAASAAEAASEVGGMACVTDVRDPEQVDAAMTATVAELGTPTILVNNAGGVFWSGLLETSPNGWDSLIRVNLTQVILCTQRVARAMVDAQLAAASSMSAPSRAFAQHPASPHTRRLKLAFSISPRRRPSNSPRTVFASTVWRPTSPSPKAFDGWPRMVRRTPSSWCHSVVLVMWTRWQGRQCFSQVT